MEEQLPRSITDFLKGNPCFIYKDGAMRCLYCSYDVPLDMRRGIYPLQRHLQGPGHIYAQNVYSEQVQTVSRGYLNSKQMHEDFATMAIKCNIPFELASNRDFRAFLEKAGGIVLNSSQSYRQSLLPVIARRHVPIITKYFEDKPFYIEFDETCDEVGRSILHILIGELHEHHVLDPFLLYSGEIQKVDAETIHSLLEGLLINIIGSGQQFDLFKLLLSDGAPYCLLVGKLFRKRFPLMKHVVCVCHNLHNLCQTIQKNNAVANQLIVLLKQCLRKNKVNMRLYYSLVSDELPKWPILTRWGTWISCVAFIHERKDRLGQFIVALPKKYNALKEIWSQDQVHCEIAEVFNYKFIVEAIKLLETGSLSLRSQVEIYLGVREGLHDSQYITRFDKIVSKNPDIIYFFDLIQANQEETDPVYTHAPITTVHAERSFSMYKRILTDSRKSLSAESISNMMLVEYNRNIEQIKH